MQDPASADLDDFVRQHPRLFVLCGAGVSTGSGIPGYRDDEGQWKRKPPVMLQDFLSSEAVRRRYWARSMAGWPMLANARPNGAHRALARLESHGLLQKLVTQNVDGLHQKAGSSDVIELHGNARKVICLDCGAGESRANIQRALEEANPEFSAVSATAAPDGDADFEPRRLEAFKLPVCAHCGGVLKPDVVFFGDGVPGDRVAAALNALEQADAVLVVGSSLMVYSGYRFCERANQMAKPIAAINMGRTRADHLFTLKLRQPCAEALAVLVEGLGANRPTVRH